MCGKVDSSSPKGGQLSDSSNSLFISFSFSSRSINGISDFPLAFKIFYILALLKTFYWKHGTEQHLSRLLRTSLPTQAITCTVCLTQVTIRIFHFCSTLNQHSQSWNAGWICIFGRLNCWIRIFLELRNVFWNFTPNSKR